jgi:hypothetical protein
MLFPVYAIIRMANASALRSSHHPPELPPAPCPLRYSAFCILHSPCLQHRSAGERLFGQPNLLNEEEMTIHVDAVFAPLDRNNDLERFAGGNETEVYRTDDGRYVVKLKSHLGGPSAEAVHLARTMRDAAEQFAHCLGPKYSIPSYYLVSGDSAGHGQVLVIQPYVARAAPLHDNDFTALSAAERRYVAHQLREIIRRSLRFYRRTGSMPDLYGRVSPSSAERARLNRPWMLPWRIWSFLVQRNLLRSHNLLLTAAPELRVVLVDYDAVRRGRMYRFTYYLARWFLFGRDHALIVRLKQ